MNEHDYEPVPGLPAPLPEGETILWQGQPSWKPLARQALRVRQIAIYFAVLVAWGFVGNLADHVSLQDIAISSGRLIGLAVAAVAVLTGFAWLAARTTMYTITTKRVVMRFGIAFPMTFQIPFTKIESAGARLASDGSGEVALLLQQGTRLAYLIMWPHVRPWHYARSQPAFRGLADAAPAAQVLSRALAASASQSAPPLPASVSTGAGRGAHVPAAA
jgi:hypothetical protein